MEERRSILRRTPRYHLLSVAHTGQVLDLTRLRLGEQYQESWRPAFREQGA